MAIEMPHQGQGQELKPRLPRKFPRRRLLAATGAAAAVGTAYGIGKAFGIPIPGISRDGNGDSTGSNGNPDGSSERPLTGQETKEFYSGEAVFSAENLPNEQAELILGDAQPINIVLRKGASIEAIGCYADSEGRKIVCTIEDPLRQGDDGTNIKFVTILKDEIAPDKKKDGQFAFADLLRLNQGQYNSADQTIVFKDGKSGKLKQMEDTEVSQMKDKAGIFFVDRDPLKKDQPLLVNPVIPEPDKSLIPENSTLTQFEDGRVVYKDTQGNNIIRARYYPWKNNEWKWVRRKEAVEDYTIREITDANNLVFSTFFRLDRLTNTHYVEMAEELANQVVIAAELDISRIFKVFTGKEWGKILQNWDSISADIKAGKVPQGYNYNWRDADRMVEFAEKEGMTIRAQHLLSGQDMLDSIINGGFSNDELLKIREFMNKARVLQYKGRIQEWDASDEWVQEGLFGNDKTKFWHNKFGDRIRDLSFIWAHEADPDAKLVYVDDAVMEPNVDARRRIREEVFADLQQLQLKAKDANNPVPVHKVGIENNVWIFQPMNKDMVRNDIQTIRGMGFEIASSEATVSISEKRPVGTGTKEVNVSDKLAAQAHMYEDLFTAYLEGGATAFGIGGFFDGVSWIKEAHPDIPDSDALVFDKDGNPKPAYFSLLRSLRNKFHK